MDPLAKGKGDPSPTEPTSFTNVDDLRPPSKQLKGGTCTVLGDDLNSGDSDSGSEGQRSPAMHPMLDSAGDTGFELEDAHAMLAKLAGVCASTAGASVGLDFHQAAMQAATAAGAAAAALATEPDEVVGGGLKDGGVGIEVEACMDMG